MAEILAGDHEAFARLYDLYRTDVYRVARAITGTHETALDVVQEVFLRVFQKLGTWRAWASLRTWILRIAVRRAVDFRRDARRSAALRPLDATALTFDPRPTIDRDLLTKQIYEATDRMTGQRGLILRLRLVAGLSNRDISLSLGLRESNVRMQLSNAVKLLRESL